ncbi:gluconolactonase [Nocardia tenerifensis]|uniref:Gluconolactonase n=1 Tax=Nocardia tenerifensis TaxID=228006 RepID=A0A318KFH8_9NOCA|nr:SMP-30/gluconolactonase/LRE family protein [Nocardia tenerifensis]PXX71589.1 gluconolactonase [Nocardia tenerifensis]
MPEQLLAMPGLLEAPLVEPGGGVVFSNVTGGGVFRYAESRLSTVLESRRGIGGLARHADGGLIVTGRDVSYARGGVHRTILAVDGATGFNDVTVGADGSLYVGVLRHNPQRGEAVVPSEVLRIDPAGVVTTVASNILWPNGLGFAPDGETLYVCEYSARRVLAVRDGRTTLFATAPAGECDGLAVDSDGGVWVALGSASAIARFTADGALDARIDLPGGFVSSLAFEGDALYVTTAGAVLRENVDRIGLPVPEARIPTAGLS